MKLRAASETDRERLARWIAADADHGDKSTAGFFCEREPAADKFAFEDEDGTVFYVRIERALRVHIQFAPRGEVSRERATAVLKEGFAWLILSAQKAGFRQLVFESTVAPLVAFCERRFGFRKSSSEVVRDIAPLDTQETQENPSRVEQQHSQGAGR